MKLMTRQKFKQAIPEYNKEGIFLDGSDIMNVWEKDYIQN